MHSLNLVDDINHSILLREIKVKIHNNNPKAKNGFTRSGFILSAKSSNFQILDNKREFEKRPYFSALSVWYPAVYQLFSISQSSISSFLSGVSLLPPSSIGPGEAKPKDGNSARPGREKHKHNSSAKAASSLGRGGERLIISEYWHSDSAPTICHLL